MASPLHGPDPVKVGRARRASTSASAEGVEGARKPRPSRAAKSVIREPPEGSALDAWPAEASGGRVAAKPSPDRERNPRSPAAPSARGRSACPPRPAPTPAWAGPERLTPSEHPARTPPRRRIGSPGLCALPVQRDEGSMGAVWRGDGRNVLRGRIAGTDVRDFRGLGAEAPVHPPDFPRPEGEGDHAEHGGEGDAGGGGRGHEPRQTAVSPSPTRRRRATSPSGRGRVRARAEPAIDRLAEHDFGGRLNSRTALWAAATRRAKPVLDFNRPPKRPFHQALDGALWPWTWSGSAVR